MRYLLYPCSILYDYITRLRNWIFDYNIIKAMRYPIPIICVGNLSIGGSGKTPHVDYIINLLKKNNTIAILSRGYKRKSKGFKYVKNLDIATIVGDEPLVLKKKHPEVIVAVEKNRRKGIKKILEDHPKTSVILLDDGFQHRKVKAGLYILLTTYNKPFFNDYLFPLGDLRENQEGVKRADIIIISKCPNNINPTIKKRIINNLNLFAQQHVYFSKIIYNDWEKLSGEKNIQDFSDYKIILVSGIANTDSILNFLKKKGHVVNHIRYADHYNYTIEDIQNILTIYNEDKSIKKLILTTEKDAVKLKVFSDYFRDINMYLSPIEISINEQDNFDKKILDYVRNN